MAGMTNIAEHIARTASSEKRHSRAQKTMDDMMMVNGHLPAPIIIHAKPRRKVSYCVHVVAYPQVCEPLYSVSLTVLRAGWN